MTILEVNNVTKRFGADVILEKISFKVNGGEKIGLVGANGSGKSTLLKMIVGAEQTTAGTIIRQKGIGIGYLAQHLQYSPGNTVYQEILDSFKPLIKLGAELRALEARMSSAEEEELKPALDRYGRLQDEYERQGGFTYEQRIEAVIEGLRISKMREQSIESLSGGEKNIVALARILLGEPDVLLLDEPANHLDFEGMAWLEEFLGNYNKTIILVSHNRYLLDRVVDSVLELEDKRITGYPGNYSAYRAGKMRNLLKQRAAHESQQKEIQRIEEMIARFELWGGKKHAIQARSKRKMLDRMNRIEKQDLDGKGIEPSFSVNERSGRIALELKGYSRVFGEVVLFDNVQLHLSSGDRVGLLGSNGTGKTTLFKDIVKHASWDNPVMRIGPKTKIGYYAQEHETLNPERSITEELQSHSELSRGQSFALLSKFLFTWTDIDKKIETLSGGEKSRVQIARLMVSDSNFLLLDEPTNHLDIQSRERMEEALEAFGGTILVVSHDRYFLDRIVDRIVEIRNPHLLEYPGNFTYFWEKRKEGKESVQKREKRKPVSRKKKRSVKASASSGSDEIEEKINRLEEEKLRQEKSMASAYRNREYKQGEKISQRLRKIETRIEQLYEEL